MLISACLFLELIPNEVQISRVIIENDLVPDIPLMTSCELTSGSVFGRGEASPSDRLTSYYRTHRFLNVVALHQCEQAFSMRCSPSGSSSCSNSTDFNTLGRTERGPCDHRFKHDCVW